MKTQTPSESQKQLGSESPVPTDFYKATHIVGFIKSDGSMSSLTSSLTIPTNAKGISSISPDDGMLSCFVPVGGAVVPGFFVS